MKYGRWDGTNVIYYLVCFLLSCSANHVRTTLKPSVKKAAKAISATIGTDLYRSDLKKVALGRWSKAAKGVAANKRGFKGVSLGRSGNKFGRRN